MIRAIYRLWLANRRLPLTNGRGRPVSLWKQISNSVEHDAHTRVWMIREIENKQKELEEQYEMFNL